MASKKFYALMVATVLGGMGISACSEQVKSEGERLDVVTPSGVEVSVVPSKMPECPTEFSANCFDTETYSVQLIMTGGTIERVPVPVRDGLSYEQ